MKNEKGITLIALIVTIIIMLILAAVVINLTIGENGIIEKAKQAVEKYTIEEIRDKVEIGIIDIKTQDIELGNKVTIESVLQELVENGIVENINKEEHIGNIGEYEVKLKYDENKNIVIEYIKKATGVRITYTLNPIGYTNKKTVSILFNVTGKVKSITKPDGLVVYPSEDKLAIDYPVSTNGKYPFIVENADGTSTTKEVIVDTIDRLPPVDFEVVAKGTKTGINISGTTVDPEADETSVKSGIDRYEYYIKKSTETDYTKYEDSEITDLEEGTYSVYVMAYDKAGNSTKSSTTEVYTGLPIYLSTTNLGWADASHMSGWSVIGSKSKQRLEAVNSTGCYAVKNSKINIDDIEKITFTCNAAQTTSISTTGTLTLGLTQDKESNEFILEKSVSIGLKTGGASIVLNCADLKGEYYLKIRLTSTGSTAYAQGESKVVGE